MRRLGRLLGARFQTHASVYVMAMLLAALLAGAGVLALPARAGTGTPPPPSSPYGRPPGAWQLISSANAPIATYPAGDALLGAAVISPSDIWAVGRSYQSASAHQTLAEHWNGSAWTIWATPNPSGISDGLTAVAAIATNDVWAVGYQDVPQSSGVILQPLVEHWDGTSWTVSATPGTGTTPTCLSAVAAVSASDVWAVGCLYADQALLLHWNGQSWQAVSGAPAGTTSRLQGIAAISSSDIWAIGASSTGTSDSTLAEHWNGSQWTAASMPALPVDQTTDAISYTGIAAFASNDVWTVGAYKNASAQYVTLAEHWDGTSWTVVPSPDAGPGDNILYALSGASNSALWAVGYDVDAAGVSTSLIEFWNGWTWVIVPDAASASAACGAALAGVASTSTGQGTAWAVGFVNGTCSPFQTLTEYFGTTPPPSNLPRRPTAPPGQTPSLPHRASASAGQVPGGIGRHRVFARNWWREGR